MNENKHGTPTFAAERQKGMRAKVCMEGDDYFLISAKTAAAEKSPFHFYLGGG